MLVITLIIRSYFCLISTTQPYQSPPPSDPPLFVLLCFPLHCSTLLIPPPSDPPLIVLLSLLLFL
jgi:hypothetical protein